MKKPVHSVAKLVNIIPVTLKGKNKKWVHSFAKLVNIIPKTFIWSDSFTISEYVWVCGCHMVLEEWQIVIQDNKLYTRNVSC